MTKKIFRSTVAVGLAVLAASLVIIMSALYSYFGKLQEQQLKDELSIAAAAMAEGDGMSYLTRLDSDNYRITWLRADGVVLYDTRADAATMENHAQREEVRQALANGAGESSRYSNTMLTKMLYYAQRLPDGTVLRLSASRVTAGAVLLGMLQPILLVIAAALILSGLLASRVSKRIVEPLNRLDLEHPLENEAYEELSPLLRRLEHQRRQIDQQMSALRRRSEEFEQITASMTEGLVLLDNSGTVLSINPAAQAVLGTDSACVGQPLVAVERDTAVSRALRDAMENGRAETCMEKDGREYQFDTSFVDALKQSNDFDEYMIQMVVVGQSIGNLDVVLKELSVYYERQKKLNYQIQDAITYPFVLILMMFVIVAALIFKVFPIFENILRQMSMSLSLMNTARILSYIGFFILLVILVCGVILYILYKKSSNKAWATKLPFFSKLNYQTEMTKFTYILSLFVSSGYSLIDAVDVILQSIDHPLLKDKVVHVKERMLEGESLSKALVNEGVYDQGYGALLMAADESGHQDEVLKTLSKHYKDDLERMLSSFLNRLEPTMIAGLSLLVGFVLISIMLPLMNVLQTLG